MATFDEIMAAAVNAHKAGDTRAAQTLVDLARGQQRTNPPPTVDESDPHYMPSVQDYDSAPASPPLQDKFGDTIRSATEAPIAATKAFGAGLVDQDDSISLQNMPDWVPSALRRPAATVADAAMTGLSAAGTALAFGAGVVGEAVGGSPTQEKKLARDLMMGLEVSAPQLAGAAGITRAGAKAARASERLALPPTPVQQTARAADDLSITPSLGAGGKVRSMTSGALENVPFAGSPIAKDAQRFVGDVERAFDRIKAPIGRVEGATGAGEALQSGAGKFISTFKAKSKDLYNRVGEVMPADTTIQSPDTIEAVKGAIAPFINKPEIAKKTGIADWARLIPELEDGLTWEAASDLRTAIGQSIGKINGPLANMDQGRLKQVYATLTADLEKAAIAGGPAAEKAWRRASNYYRRGAERIEQALDKTVNADSPERAFEAFQAMTQEGRSSANAKRLYRMKSSMPKQEWDTVAASIIDRMGRPTAGNRGPDELEFSPAKFLTDWNKMSAEAKSILLPPDVRNELSKLARVAQGSKRADAERNFSRTGQTNAAVATAFAAGVDPVFAGSMLAAGIISAKTLTNRAMLRAMNAAARGDLRQIRAIERGNSPFAEDAATILRMNAAGVAGGASNSNQQPARMAN